MNRTADDGVEGVGTANEESGAHCDVTPSRRPVRRARFPPRDATSEVRCSMRVECCVLFVLLCAVRASPLGPCYRECDVRLVSGSSS
ncbi:hypothetical protein CDAR_34601 [Caerostris darwini]|uniref:Uncharacterized protein n=1 Tax=Caerostris darwini TaxID=1538125 RepID=A0AAV4QBZ1_9ARAC|nr:hypothetical protein CDAR_34601 [Caerostris darwini]